MSGSEFERENIVRDALSAAAASKTEEHSLAGRGFARIQLATARRRSSTILRWKRIPAASASSPISRAGNRTRSSPTRSAFSAISNTAARSAPIRAPATAPASWCRFRTLSSSARRPRSASSCRRLATTPSARCSCRRRPAWRKVIKSIIADQIQAEEQLMLLGWRDVPVDNSSLGETVKPTEPAHMQVFIGRGDHGQESRTNSNASSTSCASRFRTRSISAAIAASPAIIRPSMSCRTMVYKGMFLADQLGKYYPDCQRPRFRERAGAGASAFFDQHLSGLVAGASVPDDCP